MIEPLSETPLPETTPRAPSKRNAVVREVLRTGVLMLLLFFGIRGIVQNFRVEGPSMLPTLTSGQFLWVNRIAYLEIDDRFVFGGPRRGDIAVMHAPETTNRVDLIKRIIGLPGDRLAIKRGNVYINGIALDEPYIRFAASYSYPVGDEALVIPEGQYFVLGDNRANSRDSHLGWLVPAEDLIGKAWLSYWPPAAWGVMPAVAYAQ
jgi:signal peptidase I